jgi:hypothetical protein
MLPLDQPYLDLRLLAHRCGDADLPKVVTSFIHVEAHDLRVYILSVRFALCTAGGITSPMPVHARSVTPSS